MLEFTYAWLGLLVDVSLKSLLLATVAWLALALLRLQDTNLRHRIWTGVLIGMLALPLLVPITPTLPLPAWLAIELPAPVMAQDSLEGALRAKRVELPLSARASPGRASPGSGLVFGFREV